MKTKHVLFTVLAFLFIGLAIISIANCQLPFNPETDPPQGMKWNQSTMQNFAFIAAPELEDGDWVAAYRVMGGTVWTCAGSHYFPVSTFYDINAFVPIMGDDEDPADESIMDLFKYGEEIQFVVWDASEGKAYYASVVDYMTNQSIVPTFGVNNKFMLLKLSVEDQVPMSTWIWVWMFNDARISNIQLWRQINGG